MLSGDFPYSLSKKHFIYNKNGSSFVIFQHSSWFRLQRIEQAARSNSINMIWPFVSKISINPWQKAPNSFHNLNYLLLFHIISSFAFCFVFFFGLFVINSQRDAITLIIRIREIMLGECGDDKMWINCAKRNVLNTCAIKIFHSTKFPQLSS